MLRNRNVVSANKTITNLNNSGNRLNWRLENHYDMKYNRRGELGYN